MKKEKLIEDLLGALKVPEIKSESEIWSELQMKLDQNVKVVSIKEKSIFSKIVPFVAAASVVIAVFLIFPSSNTTSFLNDTNNVIEKELSDGSKVIISPNSEIVFEATNDSRSAHLEGEAFFQVKKGVPFNVTTANGSVTVLGTSFYVTNRQDLLDVRCFTGKVKVNTGKKEVFLVKGEGISNSKDIKYSHSLVKKIQGDKLSFDNTPLSLVLEDLKLFNNVIINNLSDSNPDISMELNGENKDEIVSIISTISNLNYRKVGESTFELY